VEGQRIVFRDLWERRRVVPLTDGVRVALPSLDDLMLTKRFASRPKDVEDIRLLQILRDEVD
jgi:hypothetical protein